MGRGFLQQLPRVIKENTSLMTLKIINKPISFRDDQRGIYIREFWMKTLLIMESSSKCYDNNTTLTTLHLFILCPVKQFFYH